MSMQRSHCWEATTQKVHHFTCNIISPQPALSPCVTVVLSVYYSEHLLVMTNHPGDLAYTRSLDSDDENGGELSKVVQHALFHCLSHHVQERWYQVLFQSFIIHHPLRLSKFSSSEYPRQIYLLTVTKFPNFLKQPPNAIFPKLFMRGRAQISSLDPPPPFLLLLFLFCFKDY